ncbi:MAG: ribbon-helix-helix protein, CopG family [Acidobacteria bacterium]|nr:ribbon-helix-helix protein, CopG family [Acidobacteriota bacterium]
MTKRRNSIDDMVAQAEEGYDADEIIRRRGGRPTLGSSPSSVESVRLNPELKRDLLIRAAEQGISLSEAIRAALQEYVKAS